MNPLDPQNLPGWTSYHAEYEDKMLQKVFEVGKREGALEELGSLLLDARGNEEAGYKVSRGWFFKRIDERFEELKEAKDSE